MLPLPPVIAFTLAAVGMVALAKALAREWRRVNAELDTQEADARRRAAAATSGEDAPMLRRDASGVYRPE